MENIFENAKFGDKFRLRDGRMAIYHKCEVHNDEEWHYLMIEPCMVIFCDNPYTYAPYDKYVNKNGLGYPENLKAYNLEDVNSPNYLHVIESKIGRVVDDNISGTALQK